MRRRVPTTPCIVLTLNDTHAAYFDGWYLWNPNDDQTIGNCPNLGDGLDDFPILRRGFRDFEGGIEESHNSNSNSNISDTGEEDGGQCFLLSLGYMNILQADKCRQVLLQNRRDLIKMTIRQIIGRKIS